MGSAVEAYVTRLLAAEALVFVFPVWCYGLPAILKGFFDRIFLPGVAFKLGEDGIARPALTHIKHVVSITSYGSPWWMATFLMGNPPKRQIMNYFQLLTGGRAWRGLAEARAISGRPPHGAGNAARVALPAQLPWRPHQTA